MLSLLNISSVWVSTQQNTSSSAWSTTSATKPVTSPAYQFHSTSTCTPVVGCTSYTSEVYLPAANAPVPVIPYAGMSGSGGPQGPRKTSPWDIGPEIGVIDTPVGEPFVLLLMALLYFFIRKKWPLTRNR